MNHSDLIIVSPSFYPAVKFGGPIFSILALVKVLSTSFERRIDIISPKYGSPYNNIDLEVANGWDFCEHYRLFWVRTRRIYQVYDVIWFYIKYGRNYKKAYLNGTFNLIIFVSLLYFKCRGVQVIWSPRGAIQALNDGAGNRKTVVIKYIVLKIADILLSHDDILLCSSNEEKTATQKFIKRAIPFVMPNLLDTQTSEKSEVHSRDSCRLVMMGRVHEKKGIDIVINALPYLEDAYELYIYGEGSASYTQYLVDLSYSLNVSHRVHFEGFVDGGEKSDVLAQSGMLLLPSRSENFGNVVAEALTHGVPVLVSRYMPFQDVFSKGVGYVSDRTVEDVQKGIMYIATLDAHEMESACKNYIYNLYQNHDVHKFITEVFE